MKTRVFGCGKFRRLWYESADRQLDASEELFLERHRQVCRGCARLEGDSATALDMLRSVTLDAQINPMFEERVLRRLKVYQSREGLRYWSPAVVGAAIACLSIYAAMQMVATTASQPGFKPAGEDAQLIRDHSPLLLLDGPETRPAMARRAFGLRQ